MNNKKVLSIKFSVYQLSYSVVVGHIGGDNMKYLLSGCAAMALCVGLAGQANAQADLAQAQIQARIDARDGLVRPVPSAGAALAATPALSQQDAAVFAALGSRFTNAASAYEAYVRRATGINPRFSDAVAVRNAVRAGEAYEPHQLQEGVVAYAALLALRDADFVEGVRALSGTGFADHLAASPEAVMSVPGAPRAAAEVTGVLNAQGAALLASSRAITQAAYDVQHQSWSTTMVADQAQVLAEAKAAAARPYAADPPSEALLMVSLTAAPQGAMPLSNQAAPAVVRGLALAAMAVLGRTGDSADADIEMVLYDQVNADCLKMARINLNQCLAAAGPSYEDVFCLGRHAVGETSQCLVSASDDAAPALPEPRPRLDASAPSYAQDYAERASYRSDEQSNAYAQPQGEDGGREYGQGYGAYGPPGYSGR